MEAQAPLPKVTAQAAGPRSLAQEHGAQGTPRECGGHTRVELQGELTLTGLALQ